VKAIVSALLLGVSFQAQACTEDPWFSAPAESVVGFERMPVAHSPVVASAAPQAVERLAGQAFTPLSSAEAARFTSTEASRWPEGKVFLLRGLRYPTSNSSYSVFQLGSEVLVRFGWLGSTGGQVARVPVVVELSSQPTQVFVLCGGAL
jgi:hypothetical protein